MALTFAGASSESASVSSGGTISAVPLTLACWVNPATVSGADAMVELDDGTDTNDVFLLYLATGVINAFTSAAGVSSTATAGTAIGTGAWSHAAGVFASATSRVAYKNGVAGTEETTSRIPTTIDSVRLGSQVGTNFMDGTLAEVGIWNVALDAGEIAALAKGFSPQLIRPASLIHYYPLIRGTVNQGGSSNTTLDFGKAGLNLTETNTPTYSDPHVRLYYPMGPLSGEFV